MAVYNKVGKVDLNDKFSGIIDRSITSITTDDLYGLTSIRDYAFCNCENLLNLSIPEGITSIGNNAFDSCTSLPSNLILPSTLTYIGLNVFYGIIHHINLTILAIVPPTIASDTEWGWTYINNIYVPTESVNAYKTAWPNLANKISAISD